MNIFVSDISPIQSAINLDDKRVKHMPKESFEMISIAYYKNTNLCIAPFIIWDRENRAAGDKFNHLFNHRCTNWVASKRENMFWLWNHVNALLDEYEYRFKETHYLKHLFVSISHLIPNSHNQPKSFVNATPFNSETIFDSYKDVLRYKWFVSDEIQPVKWTNRDKPKWAYKPIENVQIDLFYQEPDYNDLPF